MLNPQGSTPATPQLPQFAAQRGAPQAAPAGKPEKAVVHGLLSAEDIDGRLSTMPPAAQNYVKKAIATLGDDLPTLMGIIVGPEAHDYFELALNAMKQAAQQGQQPNSQGAPQDASTNPQASAPDAAAGGQPAMATPGAPPTA